MLLKRQLVYNIKACFLEKNNTYNLTADFADRILNAKLHLTFFLFSLKNIFQKSMQMRKPTISGETL